MLIDTHAHVNFNAYKSDADKVIRRSLNDDVWMINVGTNYQTSKKAVEIAEKYEKGIYAAVGLHPIHLDTGLVKIKNDPAELPSATHEAGAEEIIIRARGESFAYDKYRELAKSKKVVAIGETGFDYYYRPKTKRKLEIFKEKQRLGLCQQLNLAKELNLPVIFHCRMAHQDLIEVLNLQLTTYNLQLKGVMHCFVGSLEQLQRYLEMGFYIGFDGIIFKKIEGIDFEEIIKNTPLDKILIETDCPYLTPPISVNQRLNQRESAGMLRNEPIFVKYIAERIAKIKGLNFEEIAKITTENAKRLFNI